jgi:hypothetical protein
MSRKMVVDRFRNWANVQGNERTRSMGKVEKVKKTLYGAIPE